MLVKYGALCPRCGKCPEGTAYGCVRFLLPPIVGMLAGMFLGSGFGEAGISVGGMLGLVGGLMYVSIVEPKPWDPR